MATWSEVRNYVTSKYRISNDSGSTLGLEFDTEGNRSQIIFVSGDDAVVILKSPFAKVGQVQPGRIFEVQGMFGISMVGDMYCLTHTMLTETLDTLEFEAPLRIMINEADQMEKQLGLGDNF
jgi:hypothetical protein